MDVGRALYKRTEDKKMDLFDDDDDFMEYEEWIPPTPREFNYPMFGVDEIFYNYVYEDADGLWAVIENKFPDGRFSVIHADTVLDAVYIAFEFLMKDGKPMNIISHEFFSGEMRETSFSKP